MKPTGRWFVAAVAASVTAVCSTSYGADEVMVVEPINVPLIFNAAQEVIVAPKVRRPETLCGNPDGNPGTLVDCYEFAATYVSYDAAGSQILHLPECNLVPPDSSTCSAPGNNLCAGNLALDPFQVKAPVCGELRVDVLPITTDELLTLGQQTTAAWDGASVTGGGFAGIFLGTSTSAGISGAPYSLPLIRIPASAVHHLFFDPTTTPAMVILRHTVGNSFQFGFLNPMNRVLTFNQALGDVTNSVVTPVFFGTCC